MSTANVVGFRNYRCEAANGFGTIFAVIKVILLGKRLLDGCMSHTRLQPDPPKLIRTFRRIPNLSRKDSDITAPYNFAKHRSSV